MNRLSNLVVATALVLVSCARADDRNQPDVVAIEQIFRQLEARPDSLRTIAFTFTQSATVQGQTIDSEGECRLAEGGRVRMLTRMSTQIGEVKSLLVSDGHIMWHEVSANTVLQVIRYDLSRMEASTEASMTGMGIWGTLERERFAELRAHVNQLYEFTVTGAEDGGESSLYLVEGRSRNGDDSLVATLGTSDYFLRSLTMRDGNGRITNRFTVRDPEFNARVSLADFRYVPPAGAMVEDGNAMISALSRGPRRHQMENTEAPDFTLTSLDGKSVSLKSLRGKTVVLDFWATWCGPCLQQMPHLQSIHDGFAEAGVVVIGINTENRAKAVRYLARNPDISFTHLVGDDKVSALYQIRGLPTTVIISRDGIIDHYMFGAHSEENIRAALAKSGVASN